MRRSEAAILAATAIAISGCTRGAIDVQVEARGDRSVALVYSGLYGRDRLDLGPTEATRARDWTIETAGVVFKTQAGRDALVPAGGRDAATAVLPAAISIRVAARSLPETAGTATRLGAQGVFVASRLITPYTHEKPSGRISFVAHKGAVATAYGEAGSILSDWKARSGAGFVFVGPAAVMPGAGLVFERATPVWIQSEATRLIAKLTPALDAAMGRAIGAEPDLFLAVADDQGGERGQSVLSYAATQSPGQIVIELSGAGWRDASPDAAELLWRALSSESAKQRLDAMKSRPPAWLAEGAADALADEALIAAKVWTPDDAARALSRSNAACAALLDTRPLADAVTDAAAARPCGHAFAHAAAGAKGAAALWRDFDKAAKKAGRPGVDQFLLVAADQAGAHEAALMRTLLTSTGGEAVDALDALGQGGAQ